MPLTMNDGEAVLEFACHEGNYAVPEHPQRRAIARTRGSRAAVTRPDRTGALTSDPIRRPRRAQEQVFEVALTLNPVGASRGC